MNYLAHLPNPFGLAGPPSWFLIDLAAYDPALVLFPSQEEPVYRLGRRIPHGRDIWSKVRSVTTGRNDDGSPTRHRPDAQTMALHRLAPVTSILPSPLVHWGPTILADLAARDIQRAGGAADFADRLDAQEEREEELDRRRMLGDLDALSREAYSGIVWKTGRRVRVGDALVSP